MPNENEKNKEEKIKKLLGEEAGNLFVKIAEQLAKVDSLEKEIEEIKKRLEKN